MSKDIDKRPSFQYQSNIIQYQMMLNRQIGSLSTAAPREIGKFYQTQKLTNVATPQKNQENPRSQGQQMKSRTKSVGHIYNTRLSASKQPSQKALLAPRQAVLSTKLDYNRLINYHEVENKLSSYLECTIRTNGRQKYNYLSSHYNPSYESLTRTNLKMQEVYVQGRTQNYGQGRAQNVLKVADNFKDYQPGALRQRKNTLVNQANIPNTQKKPQVKEKNEKPNNQKNDRKSLKKSRKTQSKEKLGTYQSSGSKCLDKQNILPLSTIPKKQNGLGLASMNHSQHKTELQNKLKKLIINYQVKNKELQSQLRKIEIKPPQPQPQKKEPAPTPIETTIVKDEQSLVYKNQELKQVIAKLVEFNLKGINMNKECDEKQEQIWRSIYQQVLADQQLRIIKIFINETNINQVFTFINENRMKKLEIALLKTHPDEYDPFLIEKFHQLLKSNNPNLSHKLTCKWIGEQFARSYENSEKNWLKHLSQEKMQCTIRTMVLEKQVSGLRKTDGNNKELLIRDFTRYLSTLYKANLRNRNVFQIHNRLKNMSYIGRFIELLQEKAGKGVDIRKASTSK